MEMDGSSANAPPVTVRAPKPRYAVPMTTETHEAAQKRTYSVEVSKSPTPGSISFREKPSRYLNFACTAVNPPQESRFHSDATEKANTSTSRSAFLAFSAQNRGVPVQKEVHGTTEILSGAMDKLLQACEKELKQLSKRKTGKKPAFEKYLHCKTNTALGKKRSRGGGVCMDNESELYLRLIQFAAVSSWFRYWCINYAL